MTEENPVTTTETAVTPTDAAVLHKIASATSLTIVLDELVPVERSSGVVKVHLPKARKMSNDEIAACAILPTIVEHAVTPIERRQLTVDEIVQLLEERKILDEVEKVITARKAAQKIAVFNHHDVALEAALGDAVKDVEVDEDGHYLAEGGVGDAQHAKGFVRQLRVSGPSVSAPALEAAINDEFTREDYLACTSPVRVIDEAKVMLHLRRKPRIVADALRRATVPGKKSTAHALGKVD